MPQFFLGRKNDIAEAIEVGLLGWIINSYDFGQVGGSVPGTRAAIMGGSWYLWSMGLKAANIKLTADP